jgi:hypothetical protein
MKEVGIVDPERNPFGRLTWISDGLSFTLKRQKQFDEAGLFGRSKDSITSIPDKNKGKYLAFVAIAWGFAEMNNGRLIITEKWVNRFNYDGFGRLIQ